MSAGKGPRELARIVALLIDEAAWQSEQLYDYDLRNAQRVTRERGPSETLRGAVEALLALDPAIEIHLLRDHEREAGRWMSLNDWRPTCLPRPELAAAYREWMSGEVYVDRHGGYWLTREAHNTRARAPWTGWVRRYHSSNESFAEAARRWQQECEEVL